MRHVAASALLLLLALSGCAIRPSAVTGGEDAPTGVAPGVTLYFIDGQGTLQPQERETERLGTIAETVSLLLTGPGESGLHTQIAQTDNTQVQLLSEQGSIGLRLPLAERDVTPTGIDQIVCTALASYIQAGGSRTATVRLEFTIAQAGANAPRRCPVLP
ncbi:hypothetical protein [Diaminobutyricibacter sp. McL0608]|uniref:hypothetical protein n=1 Tax=Leifsonia sp. McL0608 TaxID=3143537 RepID=UPI0031F3210F